MTRTKMKKKLIRTKKGNMSEVKVTETNNNNEQQYTLQELEEKLHERDKAFIKEYLCNGFHITNAYLRIWPNASRLTANNNGSKKLRVTLNRQYLEAVRGEFELLTGVSFQRQLREYAKIGYASIAGLRDGWYKQKDWNELVDENPDILDAIETIDTKIIYRMDEYKQLHQIEYIKVKMHNRIEALKQIDVLQGYKKPEKVEMSGEVKTSIDINSLTEEELNVLLEVARKKLRYE